MRIGRQTTFLAAVFAAVVMASLAVAPAARAALSIDIDKSTQRMTVALDGAELFVWPVSTGAGGYATPSGTFTPFRMAKKHFSREWDDAPMPHSIFFTKRGHAIHGSNHNSIGRPASHGCVRLEPKNAAILFDLVKQEGMQNTRVVLRGHTPGAGDPPAVARRDNGFERSFSNDARYADDRYANDDVVAAVPPRRRSARGWREYSDGPRYYYYRERRYDPPPPRYYRYRASPGPLEFLFGR
ncbi:MAG: L,D-transpeptidase [Pseudolabrys sp.]|nr:L,D-transpeptidase [Pseudolabrys sp.]